MQTMGFTSESYSESPKDLIHTKNHLVWLEICLTVKIGRKNSLTENDYIVGCLGGSVS